MVNDLKGERSRDDIFKRKSRNYDFTVLQKYSRCTGSIVSGRCKGRSAIKRSRRCSSGDGSGGGVGGGCGGGGIVVEVVFVVPILVAMKIPAVEMVYQYMHNALVVVELAIY